jgi:hypothetical protein
MKEILRENRRKRPKENMFQLKSTIFWDVIPSSLFILHHSHRYENLESDMFILNIPLSSHSVPHLPDIHPNLSKHGGSTITLRPSAYTSEFGLCILLLDLCGGLISHCAISDIQRNGKIVPVLN